MTTTLTRVRNWDIRLFEWSIKVVGQPYVMGETDCGSLVRAAFIVMLGRDIFEHVEPYHNGLAAVRRWKACGGVRSVLWVAGAQDVPRSRARSGDVLIQDRAHDAETDIYGAASVVIGRYAIMASRADGVVRVPLAGLAGTVLRYG